MRDLARPPRAVPLLVRSRVLLGGTLNQFGWLWLGFSMFFFWIFGLNADVTSWWHFRGAVETVPGVITASVDTGFSSGGTEHSRGTPVYANHYTFRTADETEWRGVSYATGRRGSPGAVVRIEYPAGKPQISRIVGMRSAAVQGWVLPLVLLFPLIGVGLLAPGTRRGLKGIRLLKQGVRGGGTLKSKEPTNVSVNDQPVFKLVFEFTAEDGVAREVVAKSLRPEALEDEVEEPLLYLPSDPSFAVLLDALPGSPRIDEDGQMRVGSLLSTLRVTLVPGAAILGHGIYAVCRFAG